MEEGAMGSNPFKNIQEHNNCNYIEVGIAGYEKLELFGL